MQFLNTEMKYNETYKWKPRMTNQIEKLFEVWTRFQEELIGKYDILHPDSLAFVWYSYLFGSFLFFHDRACPS